MRAWWTSSRCWRTGSTRAGELRSLWTWKCVAATYRVARTLLVRLPAMPRRAHGPTRFLWKLLARVRMSRVARSWVGARALAGSGLPASREKSASWPHATLRRPVHVHTAPLRDHATASARTPLSTHSDPVSSPPRAPPPPRVILTKLYMWPAREAFSDRTEPLVQNSQAHLENEDVVSTRSWRACGRTRPSRPPFSCWRACASPTASWRTCTYASPPTHRQS